MKSNDQGSQGSGAFAIRVDPVYTNHVIQGSTCTACGWPIGPMQSAMRDRDMGQTTYRHALCPSLKERAVLRKQALEHG